MVTFIPRGSPLRAAIPEVPFPGCLDFIFVFNYQIFDFIQLMRGEPIIARKRHWDTGPIQNFASLPARVTWTWAGSSFSLLKNRK
jgi:hypothetical protein